MAAIPIKLTVQIYPGLCEKNLNFSLSFGHAQEALTFSLGKFLLVLVEDFFR